MLMTYMNHGGPVMWILAVLSCLCLALVLERLMFLAYILIGRHRPTAAQRRWHQKALAPFERLAPSLGLLGTVIGVVQCFNVSDGRISAENVGAGLSEACYTTVFGLSIAIFAGLFYALFEVALHPENAEPAEQANPNAAEPRARIGVAPASPPPTTDAPKPAPPDKPAAPSRPTPAQNMPAQDGPGPLANAKPTKGCVT